MEKEMITIPKEEYGKLIACQRIISQLKIVMSQNMEKEDNSLNQEFEMWENAGIKDLENFERQI